MTEQANGSALLDELRRVQSVTDAALAHLAVDDLLDELLIRVSEALNTDTTAILLLDEESRELVARAAKGIEEEVEQGVRIPIGRGFAGTIAARQEPVILDEVDHTNVMNPILREKGIRSLLGVPLIVQGALIGVLHVGSLTPRKFTDTDLRLLQLVADRVALAIHVGLYERERLVAETLQRSFLPENLPTVVGAEFTGGYLPASSSGVGGDWYDAFLLPSGKIGVAVGDVVGRGLHAAGVMGRLRNGLRAYALGGMSPNDVVRALARLLSFFDRDEMATLLYGEFDPDRREFRLVNAGHLPPLLVRPGGRAEYIEAQASPPLGAQRENDPVEIVLEMEAGSTMLFYTDGLVERRTESLDDSLEELRVLMSAEPPLDRLRDHLLTALVSDDSADDIAFLALRVVADLTRPHSIVVPADPHELAIIRTHIRTWLHEHDIPEDIAYDVLVATGEAAANAIEHAYGAERGTVEVTLHRSDTTVNVSVRDRGLWRGARGANRGRGLGMMDRLATSVDVSSTSEGTSVTLGWSIPSVAAR